MTDKSVIKIIEREINNLKCRQESERQSFESKNIEHRAVMNVLGQMEAQLSKVLGELEAMKAREQE